MVRDHNPPPPPPPPRRSNPTERVENNWVFFQRYVLKYFQCFFVSKILFFKNVPGLLKRK